MLAHNKLRIAYLSGPSEAVGVYREWSENKKGDYFGTNYMKQFFTVCRELDAEAYVITTVAGEYSNWHKDGFDNREPASRLSPEWFQLSRGDGRMVCPACAEAHQL